MWFLWWKTYKSDDESRAGYPTHDGDSIPLQPPARLPHFLAAGSWSPISADALLVTIVGCYRAVKRCPDQRMIDGQDRGTIGAWTIADSFFEAVGLMSRESSLVLSGFERPRRGARQPSPLR